LRAGSRYPVARGQGRRSIACFANDTPSMREQEIRPGAEHPILLLVPAPGFRLTAHCSLLTAHCSLLTAHCSLLTAHCSPLTPPLLTSSLFTSPLTTSKNAYTARLVILLPRTNGKSVTVRFSRNAIKNLKAPEGLEKKREMRPRLDYHRISTAAATINSLTQQGNFSISS